MYTLNVECRTRKKKYFVVIFCVILTWIYGKLAEIQITTKKCSDCDIHNSWLKDASRNDQYFDIFRSFWLNIRYYFSVALLNRHFAPALICFSLQNDGPIKVTKADYRLVWCPLLRFASSILVIRPHVIIRKEQLTLSEARCHSS